jgi:hypothetical protein
MFLIILLRIVVLKHSIDKRNNGKLDAYIRPYILGGYQVGKLKHKNYSCVYNNPVKAVIEFINY